MNTAEDNARDAADERDRRRADRCKCGGGMPGRCPGPSACPMCQPDEEDEE